MRKLSPTAWGWTLAPGDPRPRSSGLARLGLALLLGLSFTGLPRAAFAETPVQAAPPTAEMLINAVKAQDLARVTRLLESGAPADGVLTTTTARPKGLLGLFFGSSTHQQTPLTEAAGLAANGDPRALLILDELLKKNPPTRLLSDPLSPLRVTLQAARAPSLAVPAVTRLLAAGYPAAGAFSLLGRPRPVGPVPEVERSLIDLVGGALGPVALCEAIDAKDGILTQHFARHVHAAPCAPPPIHRAAALDQPDLLLVLLDSGGDPLALDAEKNTAFDVASEATRPLLAARRDVPSRVGQALAWARQPEAWPGFANDPLAAVGAEALRRARESLGVARLAALIERQGVDRFVKSSAALQALGVAGLPDCPGLLPETRPDDLVQVLGPTQNQRRSWATLEVAYQDGRAAWSRHPRKLVSSSLPSMCRSLVEPLRDVPVDMVILALGAPAYRTHREVWWPWAVHRGWLVVSLENDVTSNPRLDRRRPAVLPSGSVDAENPR